MGEPYRTLLGHFRHEIAHYYWDRLVADSPRLEEFRAIVRRRAAGLRGGAATALCQGAAGRLAGALRHRLCQRPSVGGLRRDLGALLPHGRHAGDRQLPSACGCGRRSARAPTWRRRSTSIRTAPTMDRIIDAWLPLTFAVNSINRSMGIAGPLSVRAGAGGHRQAVVHPRPDSSGRRTPGARIRDAGRCGRSIAGLKRARRCRPEPGVSRLII